MAMFLTHKEYLDYVDTTDKIDIDKFAKIERAKEQTYLKDILGFDLFDKVKAGSYTELIPYIKPCLAYSVYLHYIQISNVNVTPIGSVDRISDYSKEVTFADKENKIKATVEILRSYERQMIDFIEDQEYDEEPNTTELTIKNKMIITSIGD